MAEYMIWSAKESKDAKKKEASAADTAQRKAKEIADIAANAEIEAETAAMEAAKEKLKKQTRTIFAGALETNKQNNQNTTFGV